MGKAMPRQQVAQALHLNLPNDKVGRSLSARSSSERSATASPWWDDAWSWA